MIMNIQVGKTYLVKHKDEPWQIVEAKEEWGEFKLEEAYSLEFVLRLLKEYFEPAHSSDMTF